MMKARQGFTLIELLIVVVVIGILAAIASAKFSAVRNRSFMAVTQTDMKNLVTKQEFYHSASYTYAPTLELAEAGLSPAVNVTLTHVSNTGWSAQGTHDGSENLLCGVYIGTAPAAGGAPATSPDVITCTE
ncbi:MAG TPA: prepilin-type N-terminal cleavage/methylation domain-containing protein [Longimicrobiales bacterium]|nr:prepilin-type N-terminal cleavage/methylation domain-containing protein [Longimicrobiales bacterium]